VADLELEVVKVWGDRFRANVLTGEGATFARVAHSYFLTVDDDGRIVGSDPAILRLY
jgi:hypothetical protein